MSTALAVAERNEIKVSEPQFFMPIVDVQQAMQRRQMIEAFAKNVMVDGTDYGAIPGTGGKKTLLKPGAEKLTSFFGMIPDFTVMHSVIDFDGTGEGNGEALIYYRVRCELHRGGVKVGSGDASCSSRESKYRWRNAARTCPNCGQPTIIKGKAEYGGGWLCFKKNGGCGAKFNDGDSAIEGQATGRMPNPDIADVDNTILKMAEKRALIAATLIATNVSDFFTQDMEDFADVTVAARVIQPEPEDVAFERPAPKQAPKKPQPKQPEPKPEMPDENLVKQFHATGTELYPDAGVWDEKRPALVRWVTNKRTSSSKELTADEMLTLIEKLNDKLRENADAQPALIEQNGGGAAYSK